MNAFQLFFSWPQGGVWSNIIASAVLGVPTFVALFRRLRKNHREHVDNLIAQHAEHLSLLRLHHQEQLRLLHEHMKAVTRDVP